MLSPIFYNTYCSTSIHNFLTTLSLKFMHNLENQNLLAGPFQKYLALGAGRWRWSVWSQGKLFSFSLELDNKIYLLRSLLTIKLGKHFPYFFKSVIFDCKLGSEIERRKLELGFIWTKYINTYSFDLFCWCQQTGFDLSIRHLQKESKLYVLYDKSPKLSTYT